jgi:hypothetical protein
MKIIPTSSILTVADYRSFRAKMMNYGSTSFEQEDLLADISGLTRSDIQAVIDKPSILKNLFMRYGADLFSKGVVADDDVDDATALIQAQDHVINSLFSAYAKYSIPISKIETDINDLLTLDDVTERTATTDRDVTKGLSGSEEKTDSRTVESTRELTDSKTGVNKRLYSDSPDDIDYGSGVTADDYISEYEEINSSDTGSATDDNLVIDDNETTIARTESGTEAEDVQHSETITEKRDNLAKIERLNNLVLGLYEKFYKEFSSVFVLI